MATTILIIGGGQVGRYLASMLLAGGHQVTLVEQRPETLALLPRELPGLELVAGSGANPQTLERAGIRGAEVVAAVTGADETNLVVTSLARFEFRVHRTIARVNNPKNAWLFTPLMGVDVALNQADLLAHLIAEEMSLGEMQILLKLRRGQFALVEEKVHPRSVLTNRQLQELELPSQVVIAAIMRGGQLILPHGSTRFQPEDEIFAVVHASAAARLAELLGSQEEALEG